MAYTNFTNCTRQEYEEIVYSGDSKNKIKIWFNDVEFPNADLYCEKLTIKSRILPNDGNNRFSLDNFIAKEAELILHNVSLATIQDKVKISIGTLVDSANNTYEYVPIGIFNIQDTPTTDKDKTKIELRDNAVYFDYYYNGEPLITLNGGSATKLQILNDICTQANITCDVSSFLGSSDLIGTYDNTITARTYISYLAEQSGCIAYITREGHLQFFNPSNIVIQKIPLNIVEKYEIGEPYEVERIVYEDGIRKIETSNVETLSTLYINAANPYIVEPYVDVTRLTTMLGNFTGFEIDSLSTGNILGNPAIDPFDLIQIYGYYQEDAYGRKIFVDDDTVIVAQTLANNNLVYKGVMNATYETIIGKEAREENVTIKSEPAFQKYAKTSIDSLNGEVLIQAGRIDTVNDDINTVKLRLNADEARIDVVSTNIDEDTGDIQSVRTTKGYTFDADGLKISSEEDTFNSLSDNKGTFYKDGDIILSQFTKDNMIIKDMVLYGKYYYGVQEDLVVENFTKEDAMFVAERFTNNDNEECFGHFWNMED